jgi:hypothetical protein
VRKVMGPASCRTRYHEMMARSAGFEPTASASAGLRSIQLSYERAMRRNEQQAAGNKACPYPLLHIVKSGAEGGI